MAQKSEDIPACTHFALARFQKCRDWFVDKGELFDNQGACQVLTIHNKKSRELSFADLFCIPNCNIWAIQESTDPPANKDPVCKYDPIKKEFYLRASFRRPPPLKRIKSIFFAILSILTTINFLRQGTPRKCGKDTRSNDRDCCERPNCSLFSH